MSTSGQPTSGLEYNAQSAPVPQPSGRVTRKKRAGQPAKPKNATPKNATPKRAAPKKSRPKKAAVKQSAVKKPGARPQAAAPVADVQPHAAPPVTPEERHRMIAETAYYLAEARDFKGGDDAADWLEAEGLVDAQLGER